MDEKPTRRWFRFKLSTVLILTAIVAWAMACGPWVKLGSHWNPNRALDNLRGTSIGFYCNYAALTDDAAESEYDNFCVELTFVGHNSSGVCWAIFGPKRIKWPALALAAFLTWKAAWAVVERRRRNVRAAE